MTLFVITGLGPIASILDPTSIASSKRNVIMVESLPGINQALFVVGLGMIVLGAAIRLVAMVTLKKNFSGRLRIRDDNILVKNGIYQSVRHPACLGAVLLFLGIPVMLSSVFGF